MFFVSVRERKLSVLSRAREKSREAFTSYQSFVLSDVLYIPYIAPLQLVMWRVMDGDRRYSEVWQRGCLREKERAHGNREEIIRERRKFIRRNFPDHCNLLLAP